MLPHYLELFLLFALVVSYLSSLLYSLRGSPCCCCGFLAFITSNGSADVLAHNRGLSFEFAVAKTFSAFASGLFGGLITRALIIKGKLSSPLKADISKCGSCRPSVASEKPIWKFGVEGERRVNFTSSFNNTIYFHGKC